MAKKTIDLEGAGSPAGAQGMKKMFSEKVRVFTDLELADVEVIDKLVTIRQKEQGSKKIVKRSAIIRELIIEGIKNRKV